MGIPDARPGLHRSHVSPTRGRFGRRKVVVRSDAALGGDNSAGAAARPDRGAAGTTSEARSRRVCPSDVPATRWDSLGCQQQVATPFANDKHNLCARREARPLRAVYRALCSDKSACLTGPFTITLNFDESEVVAFQRLLRDDG